MSSYRRIIFHSLSFLSCIWLSACSITDNVSYEDMEGQIPQSVFDDIKRKKISTEEAVEQLGEPVLIEKLGDNVSVMTYRFNRVQIRNWRLLLVLHSGSREEDLSYYHVAYNSDEIKKTWIDDNLRIQKYHKLVQEVDPPKDEKKSSGLNWKIPFFSRNEKKPEAVAVEKQASNTNEQEDAYTQNPSMKSSSMPSSSVQSTSVRDPAMSNDTDQESSSSANEPDGNDDAFKVDLTL